MDELTLMCSDCMQQGYQEGLKEGERRFQPKWTPTKYQDKIDNGDYIFKLKNGNIEDTTYVRVSNGETPLYFAVGYFKIVLPKE